MFTSTAVAAQRGFTLAELLVAMGVMATLLGIAIPSFGALTNNMHFSTEKNRLITLIQAARGHALNLNTAIVICHLNQGECDGVSSPITVFTDTNNNRKLDVSETTLSRHTLHRSATTHWGTTKRMRFSASGRALNGTLEYCLGLNEGIKGFKIIISRTGRIRHESTQTHCG